MDGRVVYIGAGTSGRYWNQWLIVGYPAESILDWEY
jgi:hypothetical protein